MCAVATQGNPGGNKDYLKEIELGWSNDNITWETSAKVYTSLSTRMPLSSIMKNQYIQHSCYSNQPMAVQMQRQTISLYFLLGNERLMLEIV